MEQGRVLCAGISGQEFNIDTKLTRIFNGHGVMVEDGLPVTVATGTASSGVVVATRLGSISTSADYCDYVLWGL